MTEDPWTSAIPGKYVPGHIIKGKVTKLTNFGAFVELEPDLEGLLHISELADHKIDKPGDIVKAGDEVEVKILKVDADARKIGLSLRRAQWAAEEQPDEAGQQQTTPGTSLLLSKTPGGDTDTGGITKPQVEPTTPGDAEHKSTESDKQAGRVEPAAGDAEKPELSEEANQAGTPQTEESPDADS